jgi:hypothetical protein
MKENFYNKPTELPAGFFEVCQPLAAWVLKSLVDAYDNGYSAGRTDSAILAAQAKRAKNL